MATLYKILKGFASQARDWLASGEMADRSSRFAVSDDMTGYCAVGSAYLSNLLTKAGIPHEIHMSRQRFGDHVYVVVEDYIVDVTASQFNGWPWLVEPLNPIEVRHRISLTDDHLHWKTATTFSAIDELSALIDSEVWPEEQRISNTQWYSTIVKS